MGRFAVIVGRTALFISFQNFSSVPLSVLQPQLSTAHARAISPTDGKADMRALAPTKPEGEDDGMIAVPQSGSDLDSIGQDWMTRQTNAITGGAEQKILDKMNRKMNRWMNGPDAGTPSREPSSAKTAPRTETPSTSDASVSIRPKNVRFSRVNRMDMDLVGATHLSCQYKGNSVQWDLTRNVVGDMDLNIRHDSKDSANSIHLKYNW